MNQFQLLLTVLGCMFFRAPYQQLQTVSFTVRPPFRIVCPTHLFQRCYTKAEVLCSIKSSQAGVHHHTTHNSESAEWSCASRAWVHLHRFVKESASFQKLETDAAVNDAALGAEHYFTAPNHGFCHCSCLLSVAITAIFPTKFQLAFCADRAII